MAEVSAGAGAQRQRVRTPDQLTAESLRRSVLPLAVTRARKEKHLSQTALAEKASKLPGAPLISLEQVRAIESGRKDLKLDAYEEPLVWVFKLLGLPGRLILEALGLAA